MPQAGEDRDEVTSTHAETSTTAPGDEARLDGTDLDYPTDNDEDDGDSDDDSSDSDDDDPPLGRLGQLADSECDRYRRRYIAAQGSATEGERESRVLWQAWEDATMLLRLRELTMWKREYYATEDDLPSLEVIRDYMNQPDFGETWTRHVSQCRNSEPWGEVISGATENNEASTVTLFRKSLEEWIETARRQKADLAETDASGSLPPAPRPPGPPRPFRPPSSSTWPSIFRAKDANKSIKGARARRSLYDARKAPKSRRSGPSSLTKVRSVDDPSSGESEHANQGQPGSSTAGGFI